LVVALIWLNEVIRTEEKKPTRNSEAYAIYKKGLEVSRRPSDAAGWEEAQHLFEQAIKLDPQFALAHAQLSRVHSIYYSYYNQAEVHKRVAKTEAEEALRLQPNLGEAHAALATYLSRVEHDYDAALKEYEIARKALPNDPYVFHGSGHARMRRGQFEEAIADYERATALDPMNWNMWDALGNAYAAVRRYSADEHAKKRMLEVLGDVPPPIRFNLEYSWAMSYAALTGSFEKADALFARTQLSAQDDPENLAAFLRFDTRLVQRNFDDAEKTLEAMTATIFDMWSGARVTKSFLSGELALAQGNITKARPFFEAELQFAQQEVREMPGSYTRHGQLGLIYAYLGRKEEAIAEGQHAVDLLPLTKDAYDGVNPLVNLAQIYARVGEIDKAIDLLDQLMRTPNGPSVGELQFWFWDPLRDNPRFKQVITTYSK
jgi:serine/threonine-protein kinase